MTGLATVPDDIRITDKAYLEALAAELTEEPKKASTQNTEPGSFDLEQFMADNGITYSRTFNAKDSVGYALDECPFNSSHTDGDAKIFRYTNGAISFTCHHNSCRGLKWQDVRKKYDPSYDPDSYKRIEPKRTYNRDSKLVYKPPEVIEKYSADTFRTPLQILEANEPEPEYIKTGIGKLDDEIRGLPKGQLSIVSGLRASGKSTLLAQILLNFIEQGYTSICYSGELANPNYMNWIYLIAAGHSFINTSGEFKQGYYVTPLIRRMIAEWMEGKFWLYNNHYGNKFSKISAWIRDAIADKRADVVVLDNMMILDFAEFSKDRYEAQKMFVTELLHIAQQTNCHILLVAHPRKSFGFLRLEDISGASEISNLASQVFIVHRVNTDFRNTANSVIDKRQYEDLISSGTTNIIDIAKDREYGTQDCYIPLWYEPISKRLQNSIGEFHVYPWNNEDKIPKFEWETDRR